MYKRLNMKNLFLILFVILSYNLFSQIPTQYLFAPSDSCAVALPDYTIMISAVDNCGIESITQVPPIGTILNEINIPVEVTLSAFDVSNNSSDLKFDVVLLDTIPPTITVDSTYSANSIRVIGNLLNAYHSTVMNAMDYAYNTGPDSIYSDSLDLWFDNPWHAEVVYDSLNLVTYTNNDSAHFATFYNKNMYMCPCDSLGMATYYY